MCTGGVFLKGAKMNKEVDKRLKSYFQKYVKSNQITFEQLKNEILNHEGKEFVMTVPIGGDMSGR